MFKLVMISLFILIQMSLAGITIEGKVKTADGKIPVLAHAHIALMGNSVYKPLKSIETDKTGNFLFNLDDGQNYTLFITAADHYGLQIPVLTDKKNETININIQLQAYSYNKNMDDVKIIGDWNNYKFGTADDLIKQNDGTYTYKVKSDKDSVGYQLLNLESSGHSINGTNYDALEYDGGGDYKSFVKTENGIAKIVFDPKKLNRQNKSLPQVDFGDNKALALINEIQIKFNEENAKYMEFQASAKEGSEYNWSATAALLKKYMQNDRSLVRRFAANKYASIADEGFKSESLQKVLTILPITDPLWELNYYDAYDFLKNALGKEKADKYVKDNFDNIQSAKVRASLLVFQGLDAKANDDMTLVKTIFNKLNSEYKNISELDYYRDQLDLSKAITKGKKVPDFKVKLIHSNEVVSRESMLGKYYMLDFWAVWCGPCRREMPNMHAVYKEFSSKNFNILSLSFDPKLEAVDKYRKETWPMPWLHSFVKNGFKNDLSKRFEVTGIPKPVLVNPQGIIVATGMELRGKNLRKTLDKYLNTTM